MTTLNKRAAEVIAGGDFRVNAMTDVTGFGLIGHAREMVLASEVSVRISAGKVPLLEGALECVRAGYIPGGLKNNRDFAECLVEYDDGVPDEVRALLFDPQTAGGLLISTPDAELLVRALNDAGVPAVRDRRGAGERETAHSSDAVEPRGRGLAISPPHVLFIASVEQFPDSGQVVVVVFGYEVQVVDQAHRLFQAWVRNGSGE